MHSGPDGNNIDRFENEIVLDCSDRPSSRIHQFVARDFWSTLSQEVDHCFFSLPVKVRGKILIDSI